MEDEKTPYFFANNILVHNSTFYSLEQMIKKRYPKGEPDKETVLNFILKFNHQIFEPKIKEYLNVLQVLVFIQLKNAIL